MTTPTRDAASVLIDKLLQLADSWVGVGYIPIAARGDWTAMRAELDRLRALEAETVPDPVPGPQG
jgi:hypothetical protein